VNLKDEKEKNGATEWYENAKDDAWARARSALAALEREHHSER